jgi:uncharacterized protein (DUF58 family)
MRALIGLLLALVVAAVFQSGPLFCAVAVVAVVTLGVRFWMRRVTAGLRVGRRFERRLFFGETTTVTLEIHNGSALPIPWLLVHESLPGAIATPGVVSQVLSLKGHETGTVTYQLTGRRRGFHAVGPLTLTIGDVFGLARTAVQVPEQPHLIVYPRILAPGELDLPTLALFGNVRSRRRTLGDPARVAGVRDYAPGDPLHDIHWRATAAVGALQVKQYQPATTIQTMIFLDLHRPGYTAASAAAALYATDFAVTVAATVAHHLIGRRQEVGLVTNGRLVLPVDRRQASGDRPESAARTDALVPADDPLVASAAHTLTGSVEVTPAPIPPGKGRGHLMRLLELLARVELQERGDPLVTLLNRHSVSLPWGSTAVVITGTPSDQLFMTLHRLREAGALVVLFLVARRPDQAALEARARALGIRLHAVWQDRDVEVI